MENEELAALSQKLHERFGKKFHSPKEAMDLLLNFLAQDETLSDQQLFNMAAHSGGKRKPHDSGKADSGELKPINKVGRMKRRNPRVRI